MPSGKSSAGKAIGDDVGQEVQRAVEEREEPRHAAETDDGVPAGQPPQRRQRERDADEPERPDAGLVGEIAERVRR